MIYRQGRSRPRNVYAQHGPEASKEDVFVALFDDPYDAADYCRLKNQLGHTTDMLDRSPVKIEREHHLGSGNPFCQRDGCLHVRANHAWGSSACRAKGCFCAAFVEVES